MRAKTWTGAMTMAGLVALAAAAVVTRAGAREEVREIALVARGMAFYLDADGATANPPLTFRRGERVRVRLRNETPGMTHDLSIAGLGVAFEPLSAGGTGTLDLDVPDQPGRHEYVCRPHAVMMRGVVTVE